ncbi:DinB family protein [Kitasatospora sp. NBC_00085]|uniref:DinB family protein n=1 Tax=unclassified Kitasatospora TaxID=2633591 RepID=UPI00324A93EE
MTDTTTTPESTTPEQSAPEQSGVAVGGERADLLAVLGQHRRFLRFTTRDLTDEQAGLRTTASELCLGGLIKHVTSVERGWVDFILEGPTAMGDFSAMTEADFARRADEFRMLPGDTLVGVLADYADTARRTDELIAVLPDLDASHPLPKAPWFEPGARWSARRVLLHISAETAQHAGHADIIREALDGAKTMG